MDREWSKIALRFLRSYARSHETFSAEMVRNSSDGKVPRPPSLRAWGSVMTKGVKEGWIKQIGYTKVINPRAHKANASIWQSLILKGVQK